MSGIWVVMADGYLIGFIAGCADRENLYNRILRKHGLSLLKYAFPALFRFSVIKKIILMGLESLNISSSDSISSSAELLSIAVDQKYTRKGHATLLVLAFEQQLLKWNIKEYVVMTNSKEVDSNAFYIDREFHLVGTKKHHSLVLNIYKKKVPLPE
ncbi:GNAT family N-acetyltransferase [Cylindrospermopsis raciborskii]|uniref:GNAT family N-acetyltransferase n=1 Tax=Cylindrospermopsis raciborskii TaxID=77022 RepID=UPI0015E83165|nr:GNAT family N-acetyltransferase [Cylindrospermopsis raciborskii]